MASALASVPSVVSSSISSRSESSDSSTSSVFAGVNNFTNEEPPQTPFTWTGTSLNTGFNASVYNNLGRYAYIGVNARF